MPRLRFETAEDLYEAYPTARNDVGVPATAQPSLKFVGGLAAAGAWKSALSFCAYLLPRLEAVDWGRQCLRRSGSEVGLGPGDEARLAAAEAWARDPQERNRRRALELAERSDPREASTWIAYAAGRAGGQIAIDDKHSVPTPHYATAQAVRVALILAAGALAPASRADLQRGWLEAALLLAQSEPP